MGRRSPGLRRGGGLAGVHRLPLSGRRSARAHGPRLPRGRPRGAPATLPGPGSGDAGGLSPVEFALIRFLQKMDRAPEMDFNFLPPRSSAAILDFPKKILEKFRARSGRGTPDFEKCPDSINYCVTTTYALSAFGASFPGLPCVLRKAAIYMCPPRGRKGLPERTGIVRPAFPGRRKKILDFSTLYPHVRCATCGRPAPSN